MKICVTLPPHFFKNLNFPNMCSRSLGTVKNYVVLGVGRWVKVKTLRLHYVRGEVGGIRRKHYEKHYVFFDSARAF